MNQVHACKACGASTISVPHERTKNVAPLDFSETEYGNCIALDREGDQTILLSAVAYKVLKKGQTAPMPRYLSHFASCAAAARFRKRGAA